MIAQKSIEKEKVSYSKFFNIQFCTSMIFIFFMAFSSQRMYGMTNTYRYVSRPPIRGSFYKGSELSAHSLKFFLDNVVIQKTELLDTDESKKKMKKLLILRDFVSLLADGLAGCREQQFSFVKLIFSLNDLWKDYRTEIDLIQKPTICWYGLLHLCDYLASSYGALAGENSQKERVLKLIVEDFGFSARILNRILSAQERSWGLRILFLLGCLCFCINVSTFSDAERVDLVAHILPGSLMARFDRQGGFVSLRGTILAQNGNPMNDNDVLDILRTSAQQASLRAQDQQVVQQRAAALGAAPRELPTVRIDVDRNAVGHPLSFIIERGTTQAPSLGNLPCTQFGVEDLRQPDVDPADLDLIVTACNHLLELSADTQQHDCPLCHTPRVRDHEAIIHLDPHSDQPQQAQWRIAQAN